MESHLLATEAKQAALVPVEGSVLLADSVSSGVSLAQALGLPAMEVWVHRPDQLQDFPVRSVVEFSLRRRPTCSHPDLQVWGAAA